MPQNFLTCDREQELLLPPSVREWLPEEHLAWFVVDAVAQFDVAGFYAAYRADGHGRAAHDPAMMLALLLYAYSVGERSSRAIERRCVEDVAFRVIAANQVPDHTTIARFRQRHQQAFAELFGDVLALCAEAGLVRVGVIAVDGTKLHASASKFAARSYEQIVEEILAEAIAADAAEDEQFGEDRDDELPADLRNRQGRRGWLREAKQRLEERREQQARPIPKARPDRLLEAKRPDHTCPAFQRLVVGPHREVQGSSLPQLSPEVPVTWASGRPGGQRRRHLRSRGRGQMRRFGTSR